MLLDAGWLWPFAVAGAGIIAIAAGISLRGDDTFLLLGAAALLGSPAVVVTIAGWLPREWPVSLQVLVGLLLAMPVVLIELYMAACLLADVAIVIGPGWVE